MNRKSRLKLVKYIVAPVQLRQVRGGGSGLCQNCTTMATASHKPNTN